MLPRPTADPTAARMNPACVAQESRSVEVVSGTIGQLALDRRVPQDAGGGSRCLAEGHPGRAPYA